MICILFLTDTLYSPHSDTFVRNVDNEERCNCCTYGRTTNPFGSLLDLNLKHDISNIWNTQLRLFRLWFLFTCHLFSILILLLSSSLFPFLRPCRKPPPLCPSSGEKSMSSGLSAWLRCHLFLISSCSFSFPYSFIWSGKSQHSFPATAW